MAEACLFDNRIRSNSLIIPEKFFIEQESVLEDIYIKGRKTQKKVLKKTITNIPSHGWEIEIVKHVDKEIVSPYLTWGRTLSNNPVEVKVPLHTIAISQRIWRFYGFRITLNDILKTKVLAILKSNNPFEISLLKSKIIDHIGISNKTNPYYNQYKLEITENHDRVWICIYTTIDHTQKRLEADYIVIADNFLLKLSEEIKSYIESL